MRSSSGEHFIALDHIRALAIFLVFSWHFLHTGSGAPVPFDYTPGIFFFSLLNEGHTGVSLFMVLSGYLFSKLLDGKDINYKAFYWNRLIRLAPLLLVVILIVGTKIWYTGGDFYFYIISTAKGFLLPTFPNGGWSITIEFHFYLLLPLLLAFSRKSKLILFLMIAAVITLRYAIYIETGELRRYSYWTLLGRLDQFLFGFLAYIFRQHFKRKHISTIIVMLSFTSIYWHFDKAGGFNLDESKAGLFWVFLPALEGLSYGAFISYYDNTFKHSSNSISRFAALIGNYSYSIYLLHFFLVFRMAEFINQNVLDLSNFYVACLFSPLSLLTMLPIAYLSFRFIEGPCLNYRKQYLMQKL